MMPPPPELLEPVPNRACSFSFKPPSQQGLFEGVKGMVSGTLCRSLPSGLTSGLGMRVDVSHVGPLVPH